MASTEMTAAGDVAELLAVLGRHRDFLRFTLRDLTDEQAARRTTVSELCLGGIIKHVADVERRWIEFLQVGPSAMGVPDEKGMAEREATFRMGPGETVAGILDRYEQVARKTGEVVTALPSLDVSQPLPEAPWFEKGARWSARQVLLHVLAETAQHAGHADIIRESLDGAKTMG